MPEPCGHLHERMGVGAENLCACASTAECPRDRKRCAFPELRIIQKRHHRPLVVVIQRPQLLYKLRLKLRGVPQLPLRLIQDRAPTLFATQRVYLAQLGIHRVALALRQFEPRRKQRLRLGFFHGRKIQIGEQVTRMEVASQQRIWHLPEKFTCRVVTAHILRPPSQQCEKRRKLHALPDIVGCCCIQP